MFLHHLELALRGFRRSPVLTALMVLGLAVGIGACVTTVTVLHALSGDPIPRKSAHLFYVQVAPGKKGWNSAEHAGPPTLLTHPDAMALLHARKARRQTVVALTSGTIDPRRDAAYPFRASGTLTTSDFFDMFDAPFEHGGAWSDADDSGAAREVVISERLSQKLYGGANGVGRTLRFQGHDLRVVGVLKPWNPQPRFWAVGLGGELFGDHMDLYLPLSTGRALKLRTQSVDCDGSSDLDGPDCIWLGMWAELDTPGEIAAYRRFLVRYSNQQTALGRAMRPEDARLTRLMSWLRAANLIPSSAWIQLWLAAAFLIVGVFDTVGLLLAKTLRRSTEIAVRRALGASRGTVFAQFLVESAVIGLVGGALGLVIACGGLWAVRQQAVSYAGMAHLDPLMFLATFALAFVASVAAGLFPAWRACAVAPASHLKIT